MNEELLAWYDANGRALPWRRTQDPYAVWVSEIMLQQTQVATVLPYYERWMLRFPTAVSLASASDDEALSMWQGLGYYRRCKLLLAGVRAVVKARVWPRSATEWRLVPGVGSYTAAALASICEGEVAAVVDGNVERVFARLNTSTFTGSARRSSAQAWADFEIDRFQPAKWNQAIMELGATVCRPRNPRCDVCPVAASCLAHRTDSVNSFPVPNPKLETISVEMSVQVTARGGQIGLVRAREGEWWAGLWRFPEGDNGVEVGTVNHTVTRHRLVMRVHLLRAGDCPRDLVWFDLADLGALPLPTAMRKVWRIAEVALAPGAA